MGGYLNTGGNYLYSSLPNTQQTQKNTTSASTGISTFDLNDPMAFLNSINKKISAAMPPITVNRNDFRSDINQASLDKLNIQLVAPQPVYNNYPIQGGYNVPYPNNLAYGQANGPQLVPVYVQTASGPQLSGYLAPQPQQPSYAPPYNANPNYQPYYQGTANLPINYGYAGYAVPNAFPPPLPNSPTFFPTVNNPWFNESDVSASSIPTEVALSDADMASYIASYKTQLNTLVSAKSNLRKQLQNTNLSPTEKEALKSQLSELQQKEDKLKAERKEKERLFSQQNVRTQSPRATDNLNPIVSSSIEPKSS